MAEEKASVEAHAKELQTRLNEERNSLEEARTAKHAAEEEKEQVTLKLSAALKHLPVLFPDVKTLRIGASGQLCVAAKGGGKDAPPHVKADLGSAISAIREVYFDQLKHSAFDQLKLSAFDQLKLSAFDQLKLPTFDQLKLFTFREPTRSHVGH